jgi:heat shock protein 1/8
MSTISSTLKENLEELDNFFDTPVTQEEKNKSKTQEETNKSKTQETQETQENKSKNKNKSKNTAIIIGIDLGTTNSCVAIWRNNNLEVIPDKYGNRTIPSIVSFTSRNKYVGKEAKNQLELNPENSYYEVKRLIGRKLLDQEVQNDIPFFTYSLTQDNNNNILLKSTSNNKNKEYYTPEEISSCILLELKQMAEEYLKQEVTDAVITVPAYFNDSQRQATKDAATIIGLNCIRIINEPTSAALAYGLEHLSKKQKDQEFNILVYDLGGGTLDCSILRVSNSFFEVLASTGNTHLGGADFDNRLINYCLLEFKKKHNLIKLNNLSNISFQKLRSSCESCKKILSTQNKHIITIKDFYEDKALILTLTRDKFESLCKDLFILCLKSIDDVLSSAKLNKQDIFDTILVGGATRMPRIRENINLYFNKYPNITANPDEVVAAGAAIQGYILSHSDDPFAESITLLDVIPLSMGIETIDGIMSVIIPRNSTIPIKRKKKFTTATDNITSVDIKIFEGERVLTKDNFLVGEFILNNIEENIRGAAEIEVTFSIDINSIISITAENIKDKNKDNLKNLKSTYVITGNKGRLTSEQITVLIQEARDSELLDKKEKERKLLLYEIEDLCSNIHLNLENKDFNILSCDKTDILNEINIIKNNLIVKEELNTRDLSKILTNIKSKYSTLILKVVINNNEFKEVKEINKNQNTNIYDDREDDINKKEEDLIYEKITKEDTEETLQENINLKELRETRQILLNLCNSLLEILSSNNIEILETKEENKEETKEENKETKDIKFIKDNIDDILIWAHVKEKITIIEYKQKIEQLNNITNKLNYKVNVTKQIELEQLCYTLKYNILNNMLLLDDSNLLILDQKLDLTLEWLFENRNLEEKEELKVVNYQEKLDEINTLCNDLATKIDVNIKREKKVIKENTETLHVGTQLKDLM